MIGFRFRPGGAPSFSFISLLSSQEIQLCTGGTHISSRQHTLSPPEVSSPSATSPESQIGADAAFFLPAPVVKTENL